MIDEEGQLITSAEGVENLSAGHYSKVLENRPMIAKHRHLKDAKEELCEKRVKSAKESKTPPWNRKELDTVLSFLKKKSQETLMASQTSSFVLRLLEKILKKPC